MTTFVARNSENNKYQLNMKKLLTIIIPAAMLVSCAENAEKVPAFDLANLNNEVAPGEDFYEYATGGWQKNNPLKPEFSRYGSFDILRENNEIRLNDLFKGLAKSTAAAGTVEQKISDLYKMGMDSVKLNADGASPLKPYLEQLNGLNAGNFAEKMAWLSKGICDPFFGTYVGADMMDSNSNILYFSQSGLGMGNRDYYMEERNADKREGYVAFLEKVFTLAGVENAGQAAADAFEVEMSIAAPYWTSTQQRDIAAQYNPMSSAQMDARYPHLHIAEYLEKTGMGAQDKLIVEQLSYFDALEDILAKTDWSKVENYFKALMIKEACGYLGDEFYAASFDFFQKQMAGVQEQKPRWKRAMSVPNFLLGEAVGELYVAKYFSENAKTRMVEMVRNIQTALGQHVDHLEWMSEATKAKAHEKLDAFTVKIGYPDKWKDYSSLTVDPSLSYFDKMVAAGAWYTEENRSKLGKPVDRDEWHMSPQTVNAYYNPTTNEICFPAAILQPPFFNEDADDAVNYGAIGVVIAHEMTHGFDDQGRLFDKDGNMNDWWTAEDSEAFKAKAQVLVEQFNKIEILPGVFANGAMSLGENIADQGGLRIAYTAHENSLNGVQPEAIDGFTAQQRFYLGYATLWAQNITDEEKERLTNVDVHSLGKNRVNATLRNLQTFYDAFGIKESDAMFLHEAERVVIW